MIAICEKKSGSDLKKIFRDRFWNENRDPILGKKSIPDFVLRLSFWSGTGFSIADRFQNEIRGSILIRKSLIEFEMKIDHRFFRNGFWSRSWSWLKNNFQDPMIPWHLDDLSHPEMSVGKSGTSEPIMDPVEPLFHIFLIMEGIKCEKCGIEPEWYWILRREWMR